MRLRLSESEILKRAAKLETILSSCTLCPRRCCVNRGQGERGHCGVGTHAKVKSYGPHFGEEAPLVGSHGSGTVFFSSCNLACVYCQNHTISQFKEGSRVEREELAAIFLNLAKCGCHNLNLVTPTHQAPMIVAALGLARGAGLRIPIVWNCGGYENVEVLQLLEGIVDIYMPDVKYGEENAALHYSDAPGYVHNIEAVLREMHRQVGDLVIEGGIARHGLLIRHLVLPDGIASSKRVFELIASIVGPGTYLNVMGQYRPCYRANSYPELARPLTKREYSEAVIQARELGLSRALPPIAEGK